MTGLIQSARAIGPELRPGAPGKGVANENRLAASRAMHASA